jgi:Ca-activated chloride channel homolog
MVCRTYFAGLTAVIFFLSGSLHLFAQVPEDDEVIKVETALVNVPFSVSDREGRSILGLKLENFTLFADGQPIKIDYLSTQDNPLNVVLLLDTSQSAEERLDKIKDAASEFIKQLRPNDKCMIVSFDAAARVKSEFTGNQKLLDKAIKRTVLGEKPGTLMRDAISVIVEKELPKVTGRKAIILITDGKDAGSVIGENELLHRLAESDAPIYSVLYETVPAAAQNNSKEPPDNIKYDKKKLKQYQIARQKKNEEAAIFMQKLAEITGGRSYRKEIGSLSEAFITVTEELRKQYLVGFYPDDANYNLAKHQIKIKIDKKNVSVRLKNYNLLK